MNAPRTVAVLLLAVTFSTVEAGADSCAGAQPPPSCYEPSYGPLPSPYNSAAAPCYTTRPRPCFPSSAQLPPPRPSSVSCAPTPPGPCQTPYTVWPVVTFQDRAYSTPFPSPCPAPCAPPPPSCPAPCSQPPISFASPFSPQSTYSPQSFETAASSFNPALLTIFKYLKSPCNTSPSSPCKIPTSKMIPVQLSPLPSNGCSKASPTCGAFSPPPVPCQSGPFELSPPPAAFGDPSCFSSLNYGPSSSPCGFK